jgi:hypothetical protein
MKNFSGKTMSSDPNHDLAVFVQRFFASQGADIEKQGSRLDVLAPPELAARLGIPDFCSVSIGTEATDCMAVHYGSQLLERMAQTACEQIPLTIIRLGFHYIKSQGFDRLIQELFTIPEAVLQVQSTAAVQTEYVLLTCRYLAQSDEQKEGLLPLAFNLETGAPVNIYEAGLDAVEKEFENAEAGEMFSEEKLRQVLQWVQRRAPVILEAQFQSFRDSMNRRFRRDVVNLEEYYTELKREMLEKAARPGISEQSIQERKEKIALIPEELQKKKDDLFKKYSIKIKLQLGAALLIRTPAVKISCRATVGRRQKNLAFFYNPIDKSIDPLICSNCGDGTYQVHFSKDLQLLCPRCGH